jgi:hypothetical protein
MTACLLWGTLFGEGIQVSSSLLRVAHTAANEQSNCLIEFGGYLQTGGLIFAGFINRKTPMFRGDQSASTLVKSSFGQPAVL